MAYFANGTEGEYYQAHYCARCVHDVNEDCPVYLVHLLYNYEQFSEDKHGEAIKTILGALWPRKGTDNDDCKMFIQKTEPQP